MLAFSAFLVAAGLAPWAQTGPLARTRPAQHSERGSISNGRTRIEFFRVREAGGRWHAVGIRRIERLEAGRIAARIPLEHSPLWRVDFRELATLRAPAPEDHHSEWRLVPRLDPARNVAPGMTRAESPLVWVDRLNPHHPLAAWEVPQPGVPYARLLWRNLPLSIWHPGLRGVFDVTVHVRLDPAAVEPPHFSLDLAVRLDDQPGALDVVALSVAFPDLLLAPLVRGGELPGGAGGDDLLLLPGSHGNLVPDPVAVLNVETARNASARPDPAVHGQPWPADNPRIDFARFIQDGHLVQNAARAWTYPGDCPTQFLFFYDSGMTEPFVKVDPLGRILGYGPRPSRAPGGPGLYLAAHDPEMNVKRVLAEGRGNRLRLAIRTFVAFAPDRAGTLLDPTGGAPGALWQSWHQGPDSAFAAPWHPLDRGFAWPMVIEAFDGDWLDAARRYKSFFDAENAALLRTPGGRALSFREMPPEVVPPAYQELLCVVGLAEEAQSFGGAAWPLGGADGRDWRDAAGRLRHYLDFLRAGWPAYQDAPGEPWIAVIHPIGMLTPSGGAGKSGGTDRDTRQPREGYANFLGAIRQKADGRSNHVLTALNRDHGSWTDAGLDPRLPPELTLRTETGDAAFRNEDPGDPALSDRLVAYSRVEAIRRLHGLLEDSLGRLEPPDLPVTSIPLDWYWISGQGSAAKPDWSFWAVPPAASQDAPEAGGGSGWARTHAALRAAVNGPGSVLVPAGSGLPVSPRFFLGTERLSEALLMGNVPFGHRRQYPTVWRPGALGSSGAHLDLFAEDVGLTSFLFHEYALMRGPGKSFAEFYGIASAPGATRPADFRKLGHFRPDSEEERERGERLVRYRLAYQTVCLGLITQVNVELIKDDGPGGWPLVWDAGAPGLDDLDDRLSGNPWRRVGRDDLARNYDAAPAAETANPRFLRSLIRTRSRFRQFFLGGRRIRDPRLEDPGPAGNPFWADDLYVWRWRRADFTGLPLLDTGRRFGPGGAGMSLERLVIGSYMDPAPSLGPGGLRALVVVCNPFFDDPPATPDATVRYRLAFDPARWPLPAGETWTAKRLGLDLSVRETGPSFGPGSGLLALEPAAGLAGGKLHYWALVIE